jgi:arylsulfatase A-like enzyme
VLALAVAGSALVFVGGGPGAGGGAAPAAADEPPNVVVIMTDDQTVEQMRVLPEVQARLGGEGITFTNAFVTYPLCCPSRATYLTGQYTHNHHVFSNGTATPSASPAAGPEADAEVEPENEQQFRGDAESESVAVALQQAGYHTGLLGKYLNGYGSGQSGNSGPRRVPPGWDDWQAVIEPYLDAYESPHLNINGEVHDFTGQFQTDLYAERAEMMIDDASATGQPFFLQIGFSAPHGSSTGDTMYADRHAGAFPGETAPRPPSFNEADISDKPGFLRAFYPPLTSGRRADLDARYRREVRSLLSVDEAVVRIIDRLEATGELDDTILVFTTDNGLFHGEHRIYGGKYVPYEPALRVPLIVAGPAVADGLRGTASDALVANIDLVPTILDYAGAAPLRPPDGRSLRPLLEGDAANWSHAGGPWQPAPARIRPLLITGVAGGSPRYPSVGYTGVRSADGWVYVKWDGPNGPRYELYDLNTDPHQLENLANDPAFLGRRSSLERQRALLVHCQARSCEVPPVGYLDLPPSGEASWLPAAQWGEAALLGVGYADGTFRGSTPIQRQALVSWLWRHAGAPTGSPPSGHTDVPPHLAEAVNWAMEVGMLVPVADQRFHPTGTVTRTDIARWLWRLAGQPEASTADLPPDVPASLGAAEAIAWVLEDPPGEAKPIMYVHPDGRFHRSEVVTRSRAIVTVRRYDLQTAA